MEPPFHYTNFDSHSVGIDETNGRFAEVSIETCKQCGRRWLRYFWEHEAFPRSGRWYRGLIADEVVEGVTPDTAVSILANLEWRFCGGSYFNSTGHIHTSPVVLD
ncbi:MAG TPA: hypothetical protein PLD25_23830 [Chloroflexota bacterium]|nr:hypothetical protein [Chloroflexota bacterium]